MISEALNSDVEELMKDCSFDVQDLDVDYEYLPDGKYNVWTNEPKARRSFL